jgi:pimeloyl-ACP methyl ester carboxylesterase
MMLATTLCAQETGNWRDPSPHRVQFVRVDEGIELEVLDWGGTGRPIVLLAGYLTAHSYDDFAPKLSQIGHVYGITRRGLGRSSRPESGYDAQRSAEDVLAVLNALKLAKPVLAGHSFGGQDLTTLAVNHPDRIAGIVLLNSADDPTLTLSDYGAEPADLKKLPAAMRSPAEPDYSSFQAYRAWQVRTHGVAFPESELRQIFASNPDGTMGKYLVPGSVRDAMFKGVQKPDYKRIRVPALAFFAAPDSLEDLIHKYPPQNEEERSAMEKKYRFDLAVWNRHWKDFKTGVPAARVVVVPKANFYIFLSSEEELLRELRVFVAALP